MHTPFKIGVIYKRTEIHRQYGGSGRGGICPSGRYPYVFIFTGDSGSQHGYYDCWINSNVFQYTGEGQIGDMSFVRGNLALREQLNRGTRIFLFEAEKKSYVKYVAELEFFDADYLQTHDTIGNQRQAIRFFLKRVGAKLAVQASDLQAPLLAAEERPIYEVNVPNVTERIGLVTSRVGQGAYRKSLLHKWEYKCAVTDFDEPKVLIASHIVPWKDSNDNERLDVNNGIILSPVYDALFDRNFISFENNGNIILSGTLTQSDYKKLGVTGKEMIRNFNSDHGFYLDRHRNLLI